MKSLSLSLLLIFYSASNFIFAQAGTLDSSFGNRGIKVTIINGASEIATSSAIQKDGKIVIAGNSKGFTDTTKTFIIRYNKDGRIDKKFGVEGIVISQLAVLVADARSVVIQADGKILIAGSAFQNREFFSDFDVFIIRLNNNGTIDSTFGVDGVVYTDYRQNEYVYDIKLQPDGKIIVAGTFAETDTYQSRFLCIRYNVNGSMDETFGYGGAQFIAFNVDQYENEADAEAVSIDDKGRIVLAGENSSFSGGTQAALVRLKTNGFIDSTFGTQGRIVTNIKDYRSTYISSILVLRNEKILIGGTALPTYGSGQFCLIRYNDNGALDSSFGVNGFVINSLNASYNECNSLTLQADDKIVSAGISNVSFLTARYKQNGTLDSSFNALGYVVTSIGAQCWASEVLIQNDNKIVVCGYSDHRGERDATLVRYNNDNIILPITLQNFTAYKQTNSVLLNWQTKTEQNSNYFSVQSSGDGNSFREIGIVKSKGSSNQLQQYNFTDANPKKGINYYRLKQVDADGRFTYSSIVQIDFSKIPGIEIAPNPVQNILTVKGLGTAKNLSVIDAAGTVRLKAVSENDIYNRNIQELKPGVYYLIVEENGKRIAAIKFAKQ